MGNGEAEVTVYTVEWDNRRKRFMERMAAKRAAGTYYEKPRIKEESRERQAFRVLTAKFSREWTESPHT